MKRNLFLFAMVALLLAISCKKTELNPQPGDGTGQLTFKTSVSQLTKAIHNGTEYKNETFGMFAYALTDNKVWATGKSLASPLMGTTAGLTPVEIAYIGDNWRANDGNTYFWPNAKTTS